MQRIRVITAILLAVGLCQTTSAQFEGGVSWKLPFIPVCLSIDSNGVFHADIQPSISTPIGTFSWYVGGKVGEGGQPEPKVRGQLIVLLEGVEQYRRSIEPGHYGIRANSGLYISAVEQSGTDLIIYTLKSDPEVSIYARKAATCASERDAAEAKLKKAKSKLASLQKQEDKIREIARNERKEESALKVELLSYKAQRDEARSALATPSKERDQAIDQLTMAKSRIAQLESNEAQRKGQFGLTPYLDSKSGSVSKYARAPRMSLYGSTTTISKYARNGPQRTTRYHVIDISGRLVEVPRYPGAEK